MTWSLVQQQQNTATSGASAAITMPGTPASGNLLVFTSINNAAAATAIAGFGVTSWAVAKAAAFNNYAADIWYGIVDTTPSASGTALYSGSTYRAVSMSEWSGNLTSGVLQAQSDTDTGTSTSGSTGPITAAAGPALYVSVLALSGGATASAPTGSFTGLTVANASNVMRNYSAYRIDDPTPASATSGWTISGSVQWEMSIAAFRGSVASPPPSSSRRLMLLGIGT